MEEIIKPKRPIESVRGDWRQVVLPKIPGVLQLADVYPTEAYAHREGYFVITAVEAPEAQSLGPEYHISITLKGERCDTNACKKVLADFDCSEADEDNHILGKARHFWRPVADRIADYVCGCKEEEPAITVPGTQYVWRPLDLEKERRKKRCKI